MKTQNRSNYPDASDLKKFSNRKPIRGKEKALEHTRALSKEYAYLRKYVEKHFPDESEHAREKVDMYLGTLIGFVEEDGDPFYADEALSLEEHPENCCCVVEREGHNWK